jgi:hypothetical protein
LPVGSFSWFKVFFKFPFTFIRTKPVFMHSNVYWIAFNSFAAPRAFNN